MSHQSQVILTNMCLIEDDQNRIGIRQKVFVIWSFFIVQMNFLVIFVRQKKVKLCGWRVKT